MFRRGRRPIGHVWPRLRPWGGPPLEANVRRDLLRANRLMEIGDFANAASLFEKLARTANDSGRVRQAAHLYVQAARARILGGQVKPAQDLFKQGLSAFAQADLWEPFERVGNRVVAELRQHNQPQAADDLAGWMQSLWQNRPSPSAPAESKASSPRLLPLKCPFCGASVRSDEVEWIDEGHAECDYCGSTLAAE